MRLLLLGLLLAGLAAGCGTVLNLAPGIEDTSYLDPSMFRTPPEAAGNHQVFGGVRRDARFARNSFQSGFSGDMQYLPAGLVWLVDLPLSAVGDTVTLPVTVSEAMRRNREEVARSNSAE